MSDLAFDLKLRPATPTDSRMVLDWRNEPTTIPWMAQIEAIPFEAHDPWFRDRITSSDCRFLIIEVNAHPVGQLRYDRMADPDEVKLSMNLTQSIQARGVGTAALIRGDAEVFADGFARRVVGNPHAENVKSIRMLEKAGYRRCEPFMRGDVMYVRYVHEPQG